MGQGVGGSGCRWVRGVGGYGYGCTCVGQV